MTTLYEQHDSRLPEKYSREWYIDRRRRKRGIIPGSGKSARYDHIATYVPVTIEDIVADDMPKYVESEYRYYCRTGTQLCAYCSARLSKKTLTIDHVVPRARGGAQLGPDNLVPACAPCNRQKADDSLLVFLAKRRCVSE